MSLIKDWFALLVVFCCIGAAPPRSCRTLHAGEKWATIVAFSPDGTLLAAGFRGGIVRKALRTCEMIRRTLFVLLASAVLGFAPLPTPKPLNDKTALRLLQGRWQCTGKWFWGEKHRFVGDELIIRGDKLIYASEAHGHRHEYPPWELRLNTRTSPMSYDLGDGRRLGIWKLEGDILTLCSVDREHAGNERPADFDSKENRAIRGTYKRMKPR